MKYAFFQKYIRSILSKRLTVVISASVLVIFLIVALSVTVKNNSNDDALRGSGSGSIEKIVGGTAVAGPSAYPYFVFLEADADCAGTLVAPDMVLTAAQCLSVFQEGDGVIINAYSRAESDSHIRRTAVQTITHPSFDFPYYDYGLIKLDTPVLDVAPVAINTESVIPSVNDPMRVIGMGNLEEGGDVADILQEVDVLAVSNQQCQRSYTANIIDGIMICGGFPNGGRDACAGDAGGPLLSNGFQIGIISSGNGCARPGFPGIYARVSWAATWIADTICDVSSAAPSFCSMGTTNIAVNQIPGEVGNSQDSSTALTLSVVGGQDISSSAVEGTVSPEFTASPVPETRFTAAPRDI